PHARRVRRHHVRWSAQAAGDGPRVDGEPQARHARRAHGGREPGADAVPAGAHPVAAGRRRDDHPRRARHGRHHVDQRLGGLLRRGQGHRRGPPRRHPQEQGGHRRLPGHPARAARGRGEGGAAVSTDGGTATDPPLRRSIDLVSGYIPEVNILNGCTVHVNQGELVGIIGPNGAGKSTLIKTMFGLVPVRSGQVLLRDRDITGRPAHLLVGDGLGYVPQNNNVFPSLTIEENLEMGLYLRPKEFKKRFRAVAELFPLLADRRAQKAGSLSGGERQVVAMGRALMTDPEVLFLDEPSAGLSPLMQDSVFEAVSTINASGVSILMVEQNARQCLDISDRAYVLDQGKDAYTGTGEELASDPKVIELYLGTLAHIED